ncbi:L-glutamate gamma-semialdehyde dehydrogenase [Geomonas sp. RF6]|uniref:L-glutamate gamma-semialdehyde dehydrogenase n=1 Tax=Geomonas sp. RF6 TaxID=2897342 RepID=UPI001E5EEEBB|nr:L-glutamate gamma-semialdehyde dehydrogenase [Geomonas sp. RF6]UFS70440.1 L-glutamate gamma-semialdehyde dehydrogenase [Geomonas sp. RF6]
MNDSELNSRIISRGKEIFSVIAGEKPSLFDKGAWVGKVMDWCMKNEAFKVRMFRFVDVYPTLSTGKLLASHVREYFGDAKDVPAFLSTGAKVAGKLGSLGGVVLDRILSGNIEEMARHFIIGENTGEALRTLARLRKEGFAAVVDVLGEATVSDKEAEQYLETYLELLAVFRSELERWKSLPGGGGEPHLDWGHAPKVNLSVKPSALYGLASPQDFEGSVQQILSRLRRLMQEAVPLNAFVCIDMESYRHKDITIEVYKRVRLEYRDYPHLGIVLQAYLKDTAADLEGLLSFARENSCPISIRLVKGAYWDYETVKARQNGWEIPVWTMKAQTDAAFERHARKIMENHDICHFACGSHNIRTISAVLEMARELRVPEEKYEFQLLYGMAEPVRRGILRIAGRVRLYCPYGSMVPGMGYLVRRLLENTANESFLRLSFAEGAQIEKLLADPAVAAEGAEPPAHEAPAAARPFENEPLVDFARASQRGEFPRHIALVRQSLGKRYRLLIGGREVETADTLPSVNPAHPSEIIGVVCQAGTDEVSLAIAAAAEAFPSWRDTDPVRRAEYLRKGAALARGRIFELAAWQILEIGKQWDQAYADVAEAIDFLEYYAWQMTLLAGERRLGHAPGEDNRYFYEPKGVAAVISPWNFPLAIGMGMAAAAIVAGNTVVFKPSGLTPVVGWQMTEILQEAGIPPGVLNYTPGRGSVMGDFLVDHPGISLIAFTGSLETGTRILQRASVVHPGQANVKKVVCEMGGKNAIIVDDDADLDEAVPQVVYSAFAFQGQKCSACSRVIVLDAVYDRFVERLLEMARSLSIGPAEDPAHYLGAVAEESAVRRILEYIEIGRKEGELLYESPVPAGGFYVPLAIIGGIRPEHRIAQEEIFGPVLAVMRAKDFDEALAFANSTRFALTGGVFSRSPVHLERARREFRVGNLYLNRNITGALVGRQPFGGSRMSGGGTKAGGPDYLLHFMDPRVVTENTMRRGFTPEEGAEM